MKQLIILLLTLVVTPTMMAQSSLDIVIPQSGRILLRVPLCDGRVSPSGTTAGVASDGGRMEGILEPFVPSSGLVTVVTAIPGIRIAEYDYV